MFTAQRSKSLNWNIESFIFLISLLSLLLPGCDKKKNPIEPDAKDKGTYSLEAKYSLIRSYPLGGGIFIVHIAPDSDFSGKVKLNIEADASLNAKLTTSTLDNKSQVAEITITPNSDVEIKKYTIALRAEHSEKTMTLPLEVDMFDCPSLFKEMPISKRDEFKEWALAQDPKYKIIFGSQEKPYYTYPQLLKIEHFTFLTDEYEVRLCYKIHPQPSDWSAIMIRKRGVFNGEIAARQEADGRIFTIPVSDFPLTLNY